MKREEIYAKIFELVFCEPKDKAEKETALNEIWVKACEQTKTLLYTLKPAILKTYPQYRATRLGREMPELPFSVRAQ